MPADSEIWIPPLLPKDQKKVNKRQRYRGLVQWTGFPEKTLWDWLQLLAALAIPVVIAMGTLWFSAQQGEASTRIAQDQQQESALQAYLDHMSDLLLNNKLHESQLGDEVRNVARARTLTVLPQLNGKRKGEIVRFLYESGLIDSKSGIVDLRSADLDDAALMGVSLKGADLSGADLSGADLWEANLWEADLSYANFTSANLVRADLTLADLRGANLSGTDLGDAAFTRANLSTANLTSASLIRADLSGADLSFADLRDANLSGASLSFANLRDAFSTTSDQLKQAILLQDTTMPDGSIHP